MIAKRTSHDYAEALFVTAGSSFQAELDVTHLYLMAIAA